MGVTWILLRPCLVALGLLAIFVHTALAEREFLTQEIGWPVHYFEPVDIDGDGIWELALQVGDDAGDKIGVYSPRLAEWLDGPHRRPITLNNWGCGDFDNDSLIEYTYLVRDSVRLFDPEAGIDSLVFYVNFYNADRPENVYYYESFGPLCLQVWGHTASSQPTIYLSRYFYEHYVDTTALYEPYHIYQRSFWYRYSLTTGEFLDHRDGYFEKGQVCFAGGHNPVAYLCIYDYDREEHYYDITMLFYHLGYTLTLLTDQGQEHFRAIIASFAEHVVGDCCYWWGWAPRLHHGSIGQLKSDGYPKVFWSLEAIGMGPGQVGGAVVPEDSATSWTIYPEVNPYSGLTYYDWGGDSTSELLLPLSDRDLWEIRDPQTGNLIDSIQGMPPVDLRTAPIMEPNVLDLYYFKDSTLYILNRPDMPTGIFDEEEPISIPSAFTLQQNYPNPFNASTVIEFELEQAGPVSLEIYNILGQRTFIREFIYDSPGLHSTPWDGTDLAGKAVPSGVYFYRVSADGVSQHRKMVLLR